MRQGVLISTTEHLLSVFYSMGVDNAYVEIDNLEVPILDGSGRPYVDLLHAAGLKSYRRRKRFLRIRRPVTVEAGSKRIIDSAVRPLPAHLRRIFRSSAHRQPIARHGSDARALCARRSRPPALSDSRMSWIRCATWD